MSTSLKQEIHESILYVEDPEGLQKMSSKKEELSLAIFVKNSLNGKFIIKVIIDAIEYIFFPNHLRNHQMIGFIL